MAASEGRPPPLDELVWQSNEAAAYVGAGWGVHNNNVLYYFAESPFFDRTSNNQIVRTQAEMPGRAHMIETREAFESELRKRSGLEFVAVQAQTQFGHPDLPNSQGRWVIHKQRRTKSANAPDKVEVLTTYFVLGDLVYMAPSVGSILWNRMDTLADQMKSFMATMTRLPHFSPANGYSYMDAGSAADSVGAASAFSSAVPSRAASPSEDVVMGGSQESQQDPAKLPDLDDDIPTIEPQDLVDSFRTFLQYRHEYMDEVPLVGEPGSFSFATRTSSKPPSQTTQARPWKSSQPSMDSSREQATVSATQESFKSESSKTSRDDTQGTPASVPTPKLRRRKSKAPNSPLSPSSPSGPRSPISAAPSPRAS